VFTSLKSNFIATVVYLPLCEIIPEMLILTIFSTTKSNKSRIYSQHNNYGALSGGGEPVSSGAINK